MSCRSGGVEGSKGEAPVQALGQELVRPSSWKSTVPVVFTRVTKSSLVS